MPYQTETWNPAKLEPASFPEDARTDSVMLGASQSLNKGQVLGKKTSDNKCYPYNSANSDGTQIPVAILVHDTATDASGNHFLGSSAVGNSMNLPQASVPAYVAGVFDTTKLTGWNTNAASVMFARVLPSGHVRIG